MEIENKIILKSKEIQFEKNPQKKTELKKELEILILRKQIEIIKNKIKNKK